MCTKSCTRRTLSENSLNFSGPVLGLLCDFSAVAWLVRGWLHFAKKKMTSSVRNQKYIARGVEFAISRQSTGLSSRLHKSGYTRDFSPRACNANFSKILRPLCKEKYNSSSRSCNVELSQS